MTTAKRLAVIASALGLLGWWLGWRGGYDLGYAIAIACSSASLWLTWGAT